MKKNINSPQVKALREDIEMIFEKAANKHSLKVDTPIVQSTVRGLVAIAPIKGIAGESLSTLFEKETVLMLVQHAYALETNTRDEMLAVVTDPKQGTARLRTLEGEDIGPAELQIVEQTRETLSPSFDCSVDDLSGTILACCSYRIDLPHVNLDGQICVRISNPSILP